MLPVNLIIQPVYDNRDEIVFGEVLSSFPEDNRTTQEVFLAMEQNSAIINFDKYVLSRVINYLFEINFSKRLSVNISGRSVSHYKGILKIISRIPKEHRDKLIIEVTETYHCSFEALQKFSNVFNQLGVWLARDDFNENPFYVDHQKYLEAKITKVVFSPTCKLMHEVAKSGDGYVVIENVESDEQKEFIRKEYPKAFIQGTVFGRLESLECIMKLAYPNAICV